LRLLQKDGPDRFLVGLEFTDALVGGLHARFLAELESIDSSEAIQMIQVNSRKGPRGLAASDEISGPSMDNRVMVTEVKETIRPPDLVGVATFFVTRRDRFELAPGLVMKWRTAAIPKGR